MAITALTTPNGSVSLLSNRQVLAGLGKYFVVTNPTPGTAIVSANNTSFSATANGLFVISNGNPAGGANIYLDRLKLLQTATAPTGTLAMHFEAFTEMGIVAGTGNVATRTPVNVNSGAAAATGATAQSFAAGFITIPAAAGTRRLVDEGWIQTGVTVIHDQFTIDFGADGPTGPKTGLTAARATDAATLNGAMAPVVIAPQTSGWINMWWVTSGANVPSYEFSLSYVEV